MVLWECLTWSVPFASENHWTLVKFVSNGGRPEIPPLEALPGQDTASFQGLGAYIDLIQRCWAQDPAERPSFPDIVADLRWGHNSFIHSFIHDYLHWSAGGCAVLPSATLHGVWCA